MFCASRILLGKTRLTGSLCLLHCSRRTSADLFDEFIAQTYRYEIHQEETAEKFLVVALERFRDFRAMDDAKGPMQGTAQFQKSERRVNGSRWLQKRRRLNRSVVPLSGLPDFSSTTYNKIASYALALCNASTINLHNNFQRNQFLLKYKVT